MMHLEASARAAVALSKSCGICSGLAALLDIEAHHSENRISNSHIQWYMRIRKAERLISGFILPRFLER